MRKYLAFISLLTVLFLPFEAHGQDVAYPAHPGDSVLCNAFIEMEKGSISGICALVNDDDTIKGAIVNEFGITALDFYYVIDKDEVKLENVITMLDKWYIKRVIAKDLRELLHALKGGKTTYYNEKYKIRYALTPMVQN